MYLHISEQRSSSHILYYMLLWLSVVENSTLFLLSFCGFKGAAVYCIYTCSLFLIQITGNLVLIIFYGLLLAIAAKMISGDMAKLYSYCVWFLKIMALPFTCCVLVVKERSKQFIGTC